MWKLIDNQIRRAFSNAAAQYDVLTGLHREVAWELVDKIKHLEDSRHILDIGMGTGYLTDRLTHFFPDALVVGVDFADGMIDMAKKKEGTYRIIQANAAALPFKKETFDIITSNLSFHWIENTLKAFTDCHQNLKKEGALCMTLFGRGTFEELFCSLGSSLSEKTNGIAIARLAAKKEIEAAVVKCGFKEIEISSERIKAHFTDMMALVKWTKDIGANALRKDVFIGPDLLERANKYYNEHFKDGFGIYATFEVIWVRAIK